jgi:hypothetical protein
MPKWLDCRWAVDKSGVCLYDLCGAFRIIHAERNAIIVEEIKFREIAMKVFVIALLIIAAHAVLED